MDIITLKGMIELHRRELERLEKIKPDCISCVHNQHSRTHCFLGNPDGFSIPEHVLTAGCKHWTFDGIPF